MPAKMHPPSRAPPIAGMARSYDVQRELLITADRISWSAFPCHADDFAVCWAIVISACEFKQFVSTPPENVI